MITPSQASAIADLLRDCERALDPDRPQTGETLRMLRDDLRDWARDLDGLVRDGLSAYAWLDSIGATLRTLTGCRISEQWDYVHNERVEFLGWAVSTRANGREHGCMINIPLDGATLEQVQTATATALRVVQMSAWFGAVDADSVRIVHGDVDYSKPRTRDEMLRGVGPLRALCPHCSDPLCDDRCKETR